MLSVIAATFLMAVEGFGQSFIGLSTTWDGSTLYFSTALRQAGTEQPFWGKLFVADKQGTPAVSGPGDGGIHAESERHEHVESVRAVIPAGFG